MIQKIGLLALSGAVGTLSRYGLVQVFERFTNGNFPWGTFTVNILGCAIAGFLWVMFDGKWDISADTKIFILVGFMGAFTTFSSLILETTKLANGAQISKALLNILLQNSLGYAAMFGGIFLAKTL